MNQYNTLDIRYKTPNSLINDLFNELINDFSLNKMEYYKECLEKRKQYQDNEAEARMGDEIDEDEVEARYEEMKAGFN